MTHNNKNIINEIIHISDNLDTNEHDKLLEFIEIYKQQEKAYKKTKKKYRKKITSCNHLVHKKDKNNSKMLERQSRQASMGEMIDIVAHQWKQPLNSISMLIDLLKTDFNDKNVDSLYINELEQIIHMQIAHMTTTLSEFRNFLRPSTKDETFNLLKIIENVKLLIKDEIISQNVNLNVGIADNIELNGNKNEFKHIFLNLINNSVDAFNENNISSRKIDIKAYLEDEFIYIKIEDNAGGIDKKIINKIFKPNFTTKEEGKGTGIGLYITKQLVKKKDGKIKVCNFNDGVLFTIKLHKLDIISHLS